MAEVSASYEAPVVQEIEIVRDEIRALADACAYEALAEIANGLASRGVPYAWDLELIARHPKEILPEVQDLLDWKGARLGINGFTPDQQFIPDRDTTLAIRLLFDAHTVPVAPRWKVEHNSIEHGGTDAGKLRATREAHTRLVLMQNQQTLPDEKGTQYNGICIKAIPAMGRNVDLLIRPEIATTYQVGNTYSPIIGIIKPEGQEYRLNKKGWENKMKMAEVVTTVFRQARNK